MIIIIYNYIIRDIFKQSKLLFETLSTEDDVEKEIRRQNGLNKSYLNKPHEEEKRKNISYSGYKYEVLGFV